MHRVVPVALFAIAGIVLGACRRGADVGADGTFALDGARCLDAVRGGEPRSGSTIQVTTAMWMVDAPADLRTGRSPADAVLVPWIFRGKVGAGGPRNRLLDAIVVEGPEPMRVAGVRRCIVDHRVAGILTEGVPGFIVGQDSVVEVRVDSASP